MPRFVILCHEMPPGHDRPLHWDFMLQRDEVLATWALEEPPQIGSSQVARRLADHRPAYLDYEGPISGDRGHVRRWDSGTYRLLDWNDQRIVVDLSGEHLTAKVTLEALGEDRYRWTAGSSD